VSRMREWADRTGPYSAISGFQRPASASGRASRPAPQGAVALPTHCAASNRPDAQHTINRQT
jgi:hypothetical protein